MGTDKNRLDEAWRHIDSVEPTTPFQKAVKEAMREFLIHVIALDSQVDLHMGWVSRDMQGLEERVKTLEKRINDMEKAPIKQGTKGLLKCGKC